MNQKERADKAIELLKEAKDCLEGSGGYAPVYNPGQKDELCEWLPTSENINALPEPVRKFISDLETNVDPAGIVRENILIKDTCKALVIKLEEKRKVDQGFVNTWANEFATATLANKIMHRRVAYMLKEAGVEVVK